MKKKIATLLFAASVAAYVPQAYAGTAAFANEDTAEVEEGTEGESGEDTGEGGERSATEGEGTETKTVNLLENAFTRVFENIMNPDYFMSVWTFFDCNGNVVNPNEVKTQCYFSYITQGNEIYNGEENIKIPNASAQNMENMGFVPNLLVASMDFSKTYPEGFFAYPIEVKHPGTYTLTGCVRTMSVENYYSGSPNGSFFRNLSIMVFMADSRPCKRTFVNDNGYVRATDEQGNEYATAFALLPPNNAAWNFSTVPFSTTLELTSDDKYFSIYAPVQRAIVGQLKLEKEVPADSGSGGDQGGDEGEGGEGEGGEGGDDDENAGLVTGLDLYEMDSVGVVRYYDMQGREVKADRTLLAPGLYVKRTSKGTTLIRL